MKRHLKVFAAVALTLGIAIAPLALPALAKDKTESFSSRGGMMQQGSQYSCAGWNTGFESINEENLTEAIYTALDSMNMKNFTMGGYEEQNDGTFLVDILFEDGETAFQVRTAENGVIHPVQSSMKNMMQNSRGCH